MDLVPPDSCSQMKIMDDKTNNLCLMLRVSCLKLKINDFRCYEAKIEESEKAGSRQKPEVSWVRLPAAAGLFTFLYFRLITSKFI